MKINKNEQDFVLKYFQPGKLDTRKALQKVRLGLALLMKRFRMQQLCLYACVASAG